MNRLWKAGATAAALLVCGSVTAGAVDLPGLDAGDGTTLCADSKGGVLRPTGSSCPSRMTPFVVASHGQVDAIVAAHDAVEDRVAALEGEVASLGAAAESSAARIAALEADVAELLAERDQPTLTATYASGTLTVQGSHLLAGTPVYYNLTVAGSPDTHRGTLGSAEPDGTFFVSGGDACRSGDTLFFDALGADGTTVTSDTLTC